VSQRFAYTDYAKTATPTTSADAVGYPKENAQNDARWKRWRSSTTTGNQNYDLDLGGSKTIQFVALVNVTAHAGGTVKAQYWTGAAWVDLGTFTFSALTGVGMLWVSQATTKVRILFVNSGAVSAYVEIGVVRCGGYFQPVQQIQPGVLLDRPDPTEHVASVDGQEFAQRRSRFYSVAGVFAPLAAADRDAFIVMDDAVGTYQPFFFALDHASMDRCIFGRFESGLRIAHMPKTADLWSAAIALREMR
jgi:hypothetical protein